MSFLAELLSASSRGAAKGGVSKDGAAPCFETHCHGASQTRVNALKAMLLSMRPGRSMLIVTI